MNEHCLIPGDFFSKAVVWSGSLQRQVAFSLSALSLRQSAGTTPR